MQLTMPKGMQFFYISGTFAANAFIEHHFSTFNLLCNNLWRNFFNNDMAVKRWRALKLNLNFQKGKYVPVHEHEH